MTMTARLGPSRWPIAVKFESTARCGAHIIIVIIIIIIIITIERQHLMTRVVAPLRERDGRFFID